MEPLFQNSNIYPAASLRGASVYEDARGCASWNPSQSMGLPAPDEVIKSGPHLLTLISQSTLHLENTEISLLG